MKPILLSWSSGKDSAWSLHRLRQNREYEVVGLLTTFNEVAGRVAMHAVRRELVEQQAAAAGLPLWAVPLSWPCPNEEYESRMAQVCTKAVAQGIQGIAFGDLFLEDVRAYREKQLRDSGLQTIIPFVETAHSRLGSGDDRGWHAREVDLYRHAGARCIIRRTRV